MVAVDIDDPNETDDPIVRDETFTDSRGAPMEHAWKLFDKDGSGTITTAELGAMMKSMGRPMSKEELATSLAKFDKDKSGVLEYKEFVAMMGNPSEASIRKAFEAFDADKSGQISRQEVILIMQKIGMDASAEIADRMIRKADSDGSGQVSIEEFLKGMDAGDMQRWHTAILAVGAAFTLDQIDKDLDNLESGTYQMGCMATLAVNLEEF
jgi:calmodulin